MANSYVDYVNAYKASINHRDPVVGEKLYIRQRTGNEWVDEVKRPYTVSKIIDKRTIEIQAAKCIFDGPQYYDSLPVDIVEDKEGSTMQMRWNEKHQRWQNGPTKDYPYFCVFGKYEFQPYLN